MSVDELDCYALLNVPRDASQRTIKSAYRKLVKSLHPDTHPRDPGAELRLKRINAAYHVLQHRKTRELYDQRNQKGAAVPPASGDLSDLQAKRAQDILCTLRLLKKNPRAIHGVAFQAFQRGHFRYAAALLKEAIAAFPEDPQLYRDLASCYFEMKSYEPCARMLQKALSLHPRDLDAWFNRAFAQRLHGDLLGARRTLETALTWFPGNPELAREIERLQEA
jgi:curved DNA-binding protein CbpA